jgi:hypothetical protein
MGLPMSVEKLTGFVSVGVIRGPAKACRPENPVGRRLLLISG